MPTNINKKIYRPVIDIEQDGCNICPEVVMPLNVRPLFINNGDTLTDVVGACQDPDGTVTTTYWYSYDLFLSAQLIPVNLLPLTTSTVLVNTTNNDINVYTYMRCEDDMGCVVWDREIVVISPDVSFYAVLGGCGTSNSNEFGVYTPSGSAPVYTIIVGDILYIDSAFVTPLNSGSIVSQTYIINSVPNSTSPLTQAYEVSNLGVVISITPC